MSGGPVYTKIFNSKGQYYSFYDFFFTLCTKMSRMI